MATVCFKSCSKWNLLTRPQDKELNLFVITLLLYLFPKVIKSPRPRTARWISTSIPQAEWERSLALYSSAEYHVNNLVSPVLFQEGLSLIPDNAVVVEIAPHALLQVRKKN